MSFEEQQNAAQLQAMNHPNVDDEMSDAAIRDAINEDGSEAGSEDGSEDGTTKATPEDNNDNKHHHASEDLKRSITQYTDLCNQIRSVKDDVKVLDKRKKEIEAFLRTYMIEHDIPVFKTKHGKIALYNTKRVQPMNKDFLRDAIKFKIPDSKVADEITALAFSSRPVREERKIKHTPLADD